MLRIRVISRSIESARESARRAKRAAAAIEKSWLHKLAPYIGSKKETLGIRFFVRLLGDHLEGLGTDLATAAHTRDLQLKANEAQKQKELKAALRVRKVLEEVRFYLSMTLGRPSFQQIIGATSLTKLRGGALLRAGESLILVLRDESMGWGRPAEDVGFMSRVRIATDLEAALAGFRRELVISEESRAKWLLAAEAWRKERAEKLEEIAVARRLLRALASEAPKLLAAPEPSPKARGRSRAQALSGTGAAGAAT